MITIQNVSRELKPFGEQEYEVCVNGEVVARFKHKREEGLGRCLLEAAKAVERDKWGKVAGFLVVEEL